MLPSFYRCISGLNVDYFNSTPYNYWLLADSLIILSENWKANQWLLVVCVNLRIRDDDDYSCTTFISFRILRLCFFKDSSLLSASFVLFFFQNCNYTLKNPTLCYDCVLHLFGCPAPSSMPLWRPKRRVFVQRLFRFWRVEASSRLSN